MSSLWKDLLIYELTCLADFTLSASEHAKVSHLHHASGEFCEKAGARFRERGDDFLAYRVGYEGGVGHENSLALQHIFVVGSVEGVGCGVDEDCVGPVALRAKLFEEDSEVLIHGWVGVIGIIPSGEVVEMGEDSVAVRLTDSVRTCTT